MAWLLLITVLLLTPTPDAPPCAADLAGQFDAALSTAGERVDWSEPYLRLRDGGWQTTYDAFSGAVLDHVNACPDADLSYTGEFTITERTTIHAAVKPLDVNLDGADEWLVRLDMRIGRQPWTMADLLLAPETPDSATWERYALWPHAAVIDAWHDERQRPWMPAFYLEGLVIYPQTDLGGRSYMALAFRPGIGRVPHVGGMLVLRWDELTPEVALMIAQDCVFVGWEPNADGVLTLPTSSIFPGQGCTAPQGIDVRGIPIPGAQMPPQTAD
jgi:hypothetical protein